MRSRSLKTMLAVSVASLPLAFGLRDASAAAAPADVAVGSPVAVTFYLPLRKPKQAEAAAQAIQTYGDPSFHKFLSLSDFVSKYAPTDADVTLVKKVLKALGYTINNVFANHLAIEAIAPAGTVDATLSVDLKQLTQQGRTGMAPDRAPTIPAELQGLVASVAGLNTMTHAHPHLEHALGRSAAATAKPGATTLYPTGPGDYLPADFEKFYHVNPLYSDGNTGRGSTIGIVTLADFYPADAYNFWQQIGLTVSSTRITKVDVDGGVGTVSDALGEGETDIDTQESGAIAPGAKLRVYVAPNNTNANFIDGFEAAASENIADTVSTSWGEAEVDLFIDPAAQSPGGQPELDAFHAVFLEMALQGQTIYASSGDSGSYDTVEECGITGTPSVKTPVCNAPYAVDSPANDPLITAAGGTTLPFSFPITVDAAGDTVTLSVKKERAWSWEYISREAAEQGYGADLPRDAVFSTGDGGGVSSYWAVPWYQQGVAGIATTKPNQIYTQDTGSGPVTLVTLPSNFAGRNMPDVSTNADPESGYQYIEEGTVVDGYGGTSFVAPQLNGVTALFVQSVGGRVGQMNPILYEVAQSAFPDVKAGNNWGWKATAGYDQATGVGKLDAAKLLTFIRAYGY